MSGTAEDRLRLLESCVRGIVLELDEHGRCLEVWTHDESLLFKPRSEVLGKTLREVFGEAGAAPFAALLDRSIAGAAPFRHEYSLNVQGGLRWFSAEFLPGRAPRTVVAVIADITERKQLEARILESERLAQIGLLAGGVGHEINNPLAAAMLLLTRLHRELAAQPERSDWAEMVSGALEGAERIRKIVRDLSFFTRSPDGDNSIVDLRRALDWAVDMVAPELRHRARLVRQYRAAPTVLASEARLGQVFLNLLVNSAHSIAEGDVDGNLVTIELSTDSAGRAHIDITDTGAGVAPQVLPNLFEPFATTKPRGKGTGLGLSISRRITESFDGTLELIASRPGFTCFRVTLPAATEAAAAAPTSGRAPHPSPRAHLTVLFIDDEPRFLASLQLALDDTVNAVIESSPAAALARLQAGERFDAIVCDVMMPDFSGPEFHRALARDCPDLLDRLVFMTGGPYGEAARAFLESVPNRRISKPFRAHELQALLAEVCATAAGTVH